MIREKVQYENFDGELVTEEIIFHFSLSGMVNYEKLTGRKFFTDYEFAFARLVTLMDEIGGFDEVDTASPMQMMSILTDAVINEFLANFIRAFYAERENGKFVQDETTMQTAEDSLWLFELLNVAFFMRVFGELNKNRQERRKPAKQSAGKK